MGFDLQIDTTAAIPVALMRIGDSPNELLRARICQEISLPGVKSGTLSLTQYRARLNKWRGDRQVQGITAKGMPWRSEAFEITFSYDLRSEVDVAKLGRPDVLGTEIGTAFGSGKLFYLVRAMRDNELCIDDNPFFHGAHEQLDGSSVANQIDRGGAEVPDTPGGGYSVGQAITELEHARQRLQMQRVPADGQLVVSGGGGNPLEIVVVTYGIDVYSAFWKLSQEKTILKGTTAIANPYEGLQVIYDPSAGSAVYGTNQRIDFVMANPEFPPFFWISVKEPAGIDSDETKVFSSKTVQVGMDGEYAPITGFWQGVYQIRNAMGG